MPNHITKNTSKYLSDDSSKYLKIIEIANEIERLLPVNQWKVNDIDAWVFIRNQLSWDLLAHFSKIEADNAEVVKAVDDETDSSTQKLKQDSSSEEKVEPSLFQKIKRKLKRGIGLCIYYLNLYGESIYYQYIAIKLIRVQSKFLFFTPSSIVTKIGKHWTNNFFDPVVDIAKKQNIGYSIIEAYNGVEERKPKMHKGYYSFQKLINYHLNRYPKDVNNDRVILPSYNEFLNFLQVNHGISIINLEKEVVINRIASIEQLSLFFQDIFKKSRITHVFLICYYWDWAMALVHACHKTNIKSIEMQHGSQQNWFAYSQWLNLPQEGSNILPDYFWCWTQGEVENINLWAKLTGKHLAFEGGHTWIDFFETKQSLQHIYHANLTELKKAWKEKKVILYTGQPLNNKLLSTDLVKFIQETSDYATWWIRIHPRQLESLAQFKAEITEAGLSEWVEIEKASTLPLPLLLKYTDLHITQESSSVLEAYLLGVPSIILSQGGQVFYEFVKEQNYAVYQAHIEQYTLKTVIESFEHKERGMMQKVKLTDVIDKIKQDKLESLIK